MKYTMKKAITSKPHWPKRLNGGLQMRQKPYHHVSGILRAQDCPQQLLSLSVDYDCYEKPGKPARYKDRPLREYLDHYRRIRPSLRPEFGHAFLMIPLHEKRYDELPLTLISVWCRDDAGRYMAGGTFGKLRQLQKQSRDTLWPRKSNYLTIWIEVDESLVAGWQAQALEEAAYFRLSILQMAGKARRLEVAKASLPFSDVTENSTGEPDRQTQIMDRIRQLQQQQTTCTDPDRQLQLESEMKLLLIGLIGNSFAEGLSIQLNHLNNLREAGLINSDDYQQAVDNQLDGYNRNISTDPDNDTGVDPTLFL